MTSELPSGDGDPSSSCEQQSALSGYLHAFDDGDDDEVHEKLTNLKKLCEITDEPLLEGVTMSDE